MNETLKIVLSLSLSGALLILLLFLLRPLFKEQLSKRWQYYIWLVVVSRLFLPFAPETNLMGTFFQEISRAIEQTELCSTLTQQGGIVDIPQSDDVVDGRNNLHSEQTKQVESGNNLVRNILSGVWKNLWLGWLVVALLLFIRKITVYQDFVKYIRAGCAAVVDISLLERFGKLVERKKVKIKVELYTNNLISSPLLIGFFQPSIILPSNDLSPVDFEYTILHELTHYKRRDMFYKWLVQFSVCVHWFNPLVYLMGREAGRACELSCDEAVIRTLAPQERRAYGDTLLNAMKAGGNYKDALASVTLNESKELLKERLDSIMKYKKASKVMLTVTLAVTLLLVTGATAIGAYAKTQIPPALNDTIGKPNTPCNTGTPTITTTPVSALEDLEANNITSITLTGDSCGIELVKSENKKFTFDYLGIDDATKFKVNYTMAGNNVLQITVDGTAARAAAGHYYVDDSGPNYSNVVRIGIPDREYESITLMLNGVPATLSDFNAIIGIEADDSSISLSDTDIANGTYRINNISGCVSIIATTLSSGITVMSDGECELIFKQKPQNIELDVSACRGEIVLPAGWAETYSIGNGGPTVKINNHGYTEIRIND